MIPKVIHTAWFSKDPGKPLPQKVQRCIESWKKSCPDFEIKVWRLPDWPEYKQFPHSQECFDAGISSYAYLSNLFRVWVLYTHGGFYVESDQMVIRDLSCFCEDHAFFGIINNGEIGGALMGSEAGHKFLEHLFNGLKNRPWIKKDHSLNLYHDTGYLGLELIGSFNYPFNLSVNVTGSQIIKDITVYPKNFFYPETPDEALYGYHLGMLTHYKKVSVVMPVYNSSRYLREAIDSVLAQNDLPDFELLCIDDGSTDGSADIIKSYTDDRVVYIGKSHSGIVDSLNIGIRRSIGTYIVRMDSDDIMLPGRLKHQTEWLERNPEIDILGSGFQWGNGSSVPEFWRCPEKKDISVHSLRSGNIISHPTVIMRRNRMLTLPFLYENYFEGLEDYKLWHTALTHGLRIATEPTPVIIYRQHPGQVTQSSGYFDNVLPKMERVKRAYGNLGIGNKEEPELTCIIPFQNEGPEIERTVTNIRGTVGWAVKIILVNDVSSDSYDYQRIARIFDCTYYENTVNLGVAGSRDFGVSKCTTKYFVLLDGHMRFYEDNWHEPLLEALHDNPKSIVSSNTVYFSYDPQTKIYKNEEGSEGRDRFGTYGARINMKDPGWEFSAKWTSSILPGHENDELLPIPCCLGAVYSTSCEFWKRIGGLSGLRKYGLDEPLMSLKTWLSGGSVLLMKHWGVGHLYRGSSPYTIQLKHLDQNQIYLIELFGGPKKEQYLYNLQARIGIPRYKKALETFEEQRPDFEKFRDYFYNEVSERDLDWFFREINDHYV